MLKRGRFEADEKQEVSSRATQGIEVNDSGILIPECAARTVRRKVL